ncbi:glycosyltransferase [Martelella alba]|uniref:Glycosyltransferase family 4 protein n=1 Tax=Martelella alba TaxID=2590451 RepID=A0ABY2SK88_9HYPH|nr:glycosyltransferase [Martelella alba]TKI04599.1 glycosyltransferase family 4 protein [Martelella alba]
MRIAVFTDSFFPELGGIQDSVLCSCRELGKRGHEILLFAPRATAHDYRVAGLPEREVDAGRAVEIRRLLSLPVPSSTGQSRLLVPTGRRWRQLRAFAPDVIHAHTFLGAGLEALHASRRLAVPLVGTNHWAIGEFYGYTPFSAAFFRKISVRAVTAFYNRCAMVTGPSHSVIDEMCAFGLRRPHSVVSNPVDTLRFCPLSESDRALLKRKKGFSPSTIVYAGRLADEKKIDVLIRALPRVIDQVPDAMLALAGHGSAHRRLEQLARQLGVSERVRFLGTLDKAALADVFHAADIFANASTSETQSMVLMQAMSAGLPAVGARWRALPEYIDGQSGLLAEPGDDADFARKLTQLLCNPTLRKQMGEHAASKTQLFSIATVTSRWEELYDQIRLAVPEEVSRISGA